MKKTGLHDDVANLLQRSVAEEATSKVWERFEAALSFLDAESATLFQEFISGKDQAELAQSRGLSVDEVQAWLGRVKGEISHHLRNVSPVKQ